MLITGSSCKEVVMFNWIVFAVHAGLGVFLSAFVALMAAGGGGGNRTSAESNAVFWKTFLAISFIYLVFAFLNAKFIPFYRDTNWKSILSGIAGLPITTIIGGGVFFIWAYLKDNFFS